eukprot:6406223-Ditylum_brightwellii.AAC.1
MSENLSKVPAAYGGAYIGTTVTENTKSLVWWLQNNLMQGFIPHPANFNAFVLSTVQQQLDTEKGSWDALLDAI